ncbi:MAG: pilus assembly protein [Myxococcales bacterium]|nr:pilus assembly protein [Myxococcales bacterium]
MATVTSLRSKGLRSQRRRRQRGAAMVEGAVAIPFLLLMFAAILFVNKLYETKMRAMKFAREGAWNYAMCNCGEKGDPISSTCRAAEGATGGKGGSEKGAAEGFDPSKVSKAGSGPGGDIASKDFGSSEASLTLEVSSDKFLGGYTKKVSSKSRVMCNEAPHDGNLKGWMSSAMDSWTKW